MNIFEIRDKNFYYNDEPIHILSGAIHYFRTIPEYWEDRLLKLKACGFNTVETYVAWNLHEPKEGTFDFTHMMDLERFIQLAGDIGLHVIIRPGPYICAEWEFGGLPSWLLRYSDLALRCYDSRYLEKVTAFYNELLPRLKPLLCTNNGPIIAMQVENEYGSYGNDKKYLLAIKDIILSHDIDVPLFTSDGDDDLHLMGGTLPDVYKTVNFGTRADRAFKQINRYELTGPPMCMEYWMGWFDHWGEKHHKRDADSVVKTFETMLELGGHVNFYMFHGGTNFGFMNGSNYEQGKLMPTTTSYDYDALLTEAGDMTEKYHRIKDIITKKYGVSKEVANLNVQDSKKATYPSITMTESLPLNDALHTISTPVSCAHPLAMEDMGQDYGFVLYRTTLCHPTGEHTLTIDGCHDRALIYLNGEYQGVIDRTLGQEQNNNPSITINIIEENMILDILVENLGRINYGHLLGDKKGIIKGVRINYQYHFDWTMYPLPLNNLDKLTGLYQTLKEIPPSSDNSNSSLPTLYRGNLVINEKPCDTFINMSGWNKGVVFINGFNLGRYWNIGPQLTLYLPGPLLKEGSNEILILDLSSVDTPVIEFLDHPLFI